jgi:2-polyprenyl-3-methyl-5-hydroxy-6-metoxy-1,4-benzoquinol methylase
MPENVQACPLCGGRKFARFDRRTFRGYDVVNQICESCGLILQSPRMTDSELDAFYSGQYRTIYQGQEEPGAKDLAVQRMRAAWLVEFIDRHSSGPSRYLDIGSSSGVLLETFQRRFDCLVVGVEPGDAYRDYAEQRGLSIFQSLQDVDQAGERRFDLISLIHVLEHIQDPVRYLKKLKRDYLTPHGKLLIEVPNLYVHDSFEVAHLFSFSRHTLREVLNQAGFNVKTIIAHGHPRSLLLDLYLTVLAEPAQKTLAKRVTPEFGVALKRKWGMFKRRVIQKLFPDRAWISIEEIIRG